MSPRNPGGLEEDDRAFVIEGAIVRFIKAHRLRPQFEIRAELAMTTARFAKLMDLARTPDSERRRELLREVTDLFFETSLPVPLKRLRCSTTCSNWSQLKCRTKSWPNSQVSSPMRRMRPSA